MTKLTIILMLIIQGETESVELISDNGSVLKLLATLIMRVNSDGNADVDFIMIIWGILISFPVLIKMLRKMMVEIMMKLSYNNQNTNHLILTLMRYK